MTIINSNDEKLTCQRIYEKGARPGLRILVDRLWPRSIRKEDAGNELRKWFGHDPDKFDDFRNKYRKELEDNPATKRLEDMIHHLGKDKKVTLLFSAKDEIHNQAAVLKEYLDSKDN